MDFQKQVLSRFLIAVIVLSFLVGSFGCSGEDAETLVQQGDTAVTAGKLDEAVIWYKKAIQQEPEMALAHFKIGKVYRAKGDVQLAFGELNRALQQDPQLGDARKELAFLLVENRALDQAVKVCEQYLEENGDDEDIYLILGNALAYTKQVDTAVEVLKKGQAIYPENTILEMNLAKMLVVKGDVQEGRSMMEKLATKKSDDIMILIALTRLYEKIERYDLAALSLEAAKEKFPESSLPYLSLAQLALKKNQPDSAKKIILEADNAGIKDSRLYQMHGMISHRQGNSDDALTYFKKSVDSSDDASRTVNRMILADYHSFLKEYKEAQVVLEAVIAEDSSKKQLKSRVVELFMARGEFDQARKSVDTLLKEDSSDARGHFLKGLMMMQDKDVSEARKEFSKAKELAPNAAENQFFYGMTFMNESEQISIAEISEALKKNPKLYKARMALAELYARKGDYQQSLDELDKVLSSQGGTNQLDKATGKQIANAKVRAFRIAVLMKMRNPAAALDDAKLLVELQPENLSHTMRLAEIYFATKNLDEALPLFQKLQKEKPESVQILNRIVGVFMLKKEPESAMKTVDTFLADYPENSAAIMVKAKIYLSQGYLDLAENILIPVADKGEHVAPVVMLAELYRQKKDDDKVITYYRKGLEIAPDNVNILMKIAGFHLKQGNYSEAISNYEKVLEKTSNHLPAMNNLAFLYSEEGKNLDRALELANAVSKKLPDNPDVADTLGWIYVIKKVYSQAEPHLQKAIDAKPDNPTIMYHMGMLRLGQKKLQDSEKLLTEAIQLGASGDTLTKTNEALAEIEKVKEQLRKAVSEKNQGNVSQAIAIFEEILETEGFNSEAASDLAMIYAEQNKDMTKALALAKKAYELQPANPQAADALGWVYYHQGSLLMAKQYIEEAIENDEKYAPARLHLGAVYLKKEEPEAAQKALEIAKSMDLSTVDQQRVDELLLEISDK